METPEAWLCASIIAFTFLALVATRIPADVVLLVSLVCLVVTGVIDLKTAVSGWSNQSVLTVAALYVVADGMRRAGALRILCKPMLADKKHGTRTALAILVFPVAMLSAFINNTPVVAMLLPSVSKWAKDQQRGLRTWLIPLSYAAILGGTCTIIGTSTNLLVGALVYEQAQVEISFFAITPIGLTVTVVGLLYVIFVAPIFLTKPSKDEDLFEHPEEFTLEFIVPIGSPIAGLTLGEVKIAHKQGLNPAEIVRGETLIPAPQSGELIQEGDRLIFAGPAVELLAVHQVTGLDPAEDRLFGKEPGKARRVLVTTVLAMRSPLIGTRIGEGRFRRLYGGAVMAVARSGERISAANQSEWTFKPGDTLLIEARHDFMRQHADNRDFYMVTNADETLPDQKYMPWIGLVLVVALMAIVAFDLVSMLLGSVVVGLIFYALRVFDAVQARTSIDLQVVCVMAAAIGIGAALQQSGIVDSFAHSIVNISSPWIALVVLYIATAALTEVLSNAAAAAVMTPLALALAAALGGSPIPWALTVMMAASASFITPLGYQTNLMVYGPGKYHVKDFVIIGLPLSIIVGVITILIAPTLGPLSG